MEAILRNRNLKLRVYWLRRALEVVGKGLLIALHDALGETRLVRVRGVGQAPEERHEIETQYYLYGHPLRRFD